MSNQTHEEMPELVREERAKYIQALKSGDYEQVTGSYSYDGAFCAVGVMLSLTYSDIDPVNFGREFSTAPLEETYLMSGDQVNELVTLNDIFSLSFEEIAASLVNRGFLDGVDYPFYFANQH